MHTYNATFKSNYESVLIVLERLDIVDYQNSTKSPLQIYLTNYNIHIIAWKIWTTMLSD
jgi:hypothetical protein